MRIWKAALPKLSPDAVFYMIGGTRNEDDRALLNNLKQMAQDMNLGDTVKFMIDQPRSEIDKMFAKAKVGLHTMKEEHFGITIVEMMSAGLITIAHASGGPLRDIIGSTEERVGFLCSKTQEFADQVVLAMNKFDLAEMKELREQAWKHVEENFTNASFDSKFVKLLSSK